MLALFVAPIHRLPQAVRDLATKRLLLDGWRWQRRSLHLVMRCQFLFTSLKVSSFTRDGDFYCRKYIVDKKILIPYRDKVTLRFVILGEDVLDLKYGQYPQKLRSGVKSE